MSYSFNFFIAYSEANLIKFNGISSQGGVPTSGSPILNCPAPGGAAVSTWLLLHPIEAVTAFRGSLREEEAHFLLLVRALAPQRASARFLLDQFGVGLHEPTRMLEFSSGEFSRIHYVPPTPACPTLLLPHPVPTFSGSSLPQKSSLPAAVRLIAGQLYAAFSWCRDLVPTVTAPVLAVSPYHRH